MAALLLCRALRPRRVRRPRRSPSRSPTAVVRVGQHRPVRDRQPRRAGPAPLGRRARDQHRDRRRAARRWRRCSTASPRARSGRWRSRSTWAARTCSASEGWKLVPAHFAERHGLIVIIALGESIVAIGVGVGGGARASARVVAAVLGVGARGGAVVALLRRRRARRRAAARARRGRARAERDGARLLLLPALPDGRRDRPRRPRAEEDARPRRRPARGGARVRAARRHGAATCSGHVAFRYRHVHTINVQRTALAVLLVAPLPAGDRDPRAGDRRRTSPCSRGR